MRDDIIEPLDDPLISKDGRILKRPAMPGAGRREGSLNKITADLKRVIVGGAIDSDYGADPNDKKAPHSIENYMKNFANKHPEVYFTAAVAKLIPKVIRTSTQSETTVDITYRTVDEVKQALLDAGMAPTQIRQLEAMMPDTGKPLDDEEAAHDEDDAA
jgi:hypothetical protein